MNILAVYLDLEHCPFSFNFNSSENHQIHHSRSLDELKSQLVLSNETYDFICVSDSLLQYWKQQGILLDKVYLANWLRLLKPGGGALSREYGVH